MKNKVHIRGPMRTVDPMGDEILKDVLTACRMPFRRGKPYMVTSNPGLVTCVKCHRLLNITDYRLWRRLGWGVWTYFDYRIEQRHCTPGMGPAWAPNTSSYWEVTLNGRVLLQEQMFWQIQQKLIAHHKKRSKWKPPVDLKRMVRD